VPTPKSIERVPQGGGNPGAKETYPRGKENVPLGQEKLAPWVTPKGARDVPLGQRTTPPKGAKEIPPKEYPSLGKIPPYRGRGFAESLV
jgi:hypothetical protein